MGLDVAMVGAHVVLRCMGLEVAMVGAHVALRCMGLEVAVVGLTWLFFISVAPNVNK